MLLNISYDIMKSLNIKLSFDDGTTKENLVSIGDTVTIIYNKDGLRKSITGVVKKIDSLTNKCSNRCATEEYYLAIDGSEAGSAVLARVFVSKILDVEVLKVESSNNAITSPAGAMNITDMRLNGNRVEISADNGKTWIKMVEINNMPLVPSSLKKIANKISDLLPKNMNAALREKLIVELSKLYADYNPDTITIEELKEQIYLIDQEVHDNRRHISKNKRDININAQHIEDVDKENDEIKEDYLLAQQDDETFVMDFDE